MMDLNIQRYERPLVYVGGGLNPGEIITQQDNTGIVWAFGKQRLVSTVSYAAVGDYLHVEDVTRWEFCADIHGRITNLPDLSALGFTSQPLPAFGSVVPPLDVASSIAAVHRLVSVDHRKVDAVSMDDVGYDVDGLYDILGDVLTPDEDDFMRRMREMLDHAD